MTPARHPAAAGTSTRPADLKAYRREYLATLPATVRGAVERAFAGTASPRAAVKAYCLVCSDCDRAEVADCLVVACPLHSYRPFQNVRKPVKEARGSEPSTTTAAGGVPI